MLSCVWDKISNLVIQLQLLWCFSLAPSPVYFASFIALHRIDRWYFGLKYTHVSQPTFIHGQVGANQYEPSERLADISLLFYPIFPSCLEEIQAILPNHMVFSHNLCLLTSYGSSSPHPRPVSSSISLLPMFMALSLSEVIEC